MLSRTARLMASSSPPIVRRELNTFTPVLQRNANARPGSRRQQIPYRQRSRPASRFSPEHAQGSMAGDYEPLEYGEGGTSLQPSKPVIIPSDPDGVLQDSHAARELLAHDTLVVVRQIEMLNIFVGFEQANRYAIYTPQGELVGFLAEEEQSIVSTLSRQFLRTHRPFRAVIMDKHGAPILWVRRPFQFINSRIHVRSSAEEDGKLVGEAQQEWHPWRRRYNVFQTRGHDTFSQFARIDGGFWAWDFWLKNKDDRLVASINRNFRGLGRELFTDTGQYVIRFDAAGTELEMAPGTAFEVQGQKLIMPSGPEGSLTMDQRAMTLATAVSIDFDYFSRHSGAGGMGFPFFMWGGGDGGSDMQSGAAGGAASGAGPGAAAGAASGAMQGQEGREMSEDELIYGPQPGQPSPPANNQPGYGDDYPDAAPRGFEDEGYDSAESGWYPDQDDTMDDPWAEEGSDGGLFGGGGSDGDWGDWGQ